MTAFEVIIVSMICGAIGALIAGPPGFPIGGGVGCLLLLLLVVVVRTRSPAYPPAATEGEFTGVYVPHWEVPRFAVPAGRTLLGAPRVDKWLPHIPQELIAAHSIDVGGRNREGRIYRMHVRGRLGPSGTYGHRGMCSRELFVSEILRCEETKNGGPTW